MRACTIVEMVLIPTKLLRSTRPRCNWDHAALLPHIPIAEWDADALKSYGISEYHRKHGLVVLKLRYLINSA